MEHIYVVNGNEYGVTLSTKKNFDNFSDGEKYFEEIKRNDFGCVMVYVDKDGIEKIIKTFTIDEDNQS